MAMDVRDDIDFQRIAPADIPDLQAMAGEIWRAVYPEFLSSEQIDYMLADMYSEEKLAGDIGEGEGEANGMVYEWIVDAAGQQRLGFLAYSGDPGRDSVFIDKLYLLPECHGRGIGPVSYTHLTLPTTVIV